MRPALLVTPHHPPATSSESDSVLITDEVIIVGDVEVGRDSLTHHWPVKVLMTGWILWHRNRNRKYFPIKLHLSSMYYIVHSDG